jgi:hypothetical protein
VSELHAQFNRALFDDTIAENARLKAEVERLEEEKKLPFAYGGKQLLVDLNKLLTAHRKYCDINRIDYTQMERDALS